MIRLNADVFAPMPVPSVMTAMRTNPGERASDLMAKRRSPRTGLCAGGAPDESEDATLFDTQIDAVQRDGRAEGLAEISAAPSVDTGEAAPPRAGELARSAYSARSASVGLILEAYLAGM